MSASPAPPSIKIVLLNGPHIGESAEVPPEGGFVGRSRGSLVALGRGSHRLVSGHHLRFVAEEGRWWIEDADSMNGTWRNGVRLRGRQALEPDDELELGRPGLEGTLKFYVTFVAARRALFGVDAT